MRILSQGNGKYDLQYENVVLEKMVDSNTIYAYTGAGQPFNMANYSSTTKMDKAMEMLHEAYTGTFFAQNLELPEGGINDLKQLMKHGYGCVCIEKDSQDARFEPLNICFQFPADEEIEV